jgi:hypothetical protein
LKPTPEALEELGKPLEEMKHERWVTARRDGGGLIEMMKTADENG